MLPATGFRNVPGRGAGAQVAGRRVLVGTSRLMADESVAVDALIGRRDELAAAGRTSVLVAVDGRAVAVIALADAARETAPAAVAALHQAGVQVVMLTGDNQATAQRIADQLGIDTVIAEVLPADKATKVAELQAAGRRVAMVGDGVNDAPALAQADLGIAIGAGTDVAIETADVVLMRSDPLDVPVALTVGRGTLRKMRQNLGWAIGYNAIALPIAAGVFYPGFGLMLRPEIAALTMSGSSLIVAVNALMLKRLRLPEQHATPGRPACPSTREPDGTCRTVGCQPTSWTWEHLMDRRDLHGIFIESQVRPHRRRLASLVSRAPVLPVRGFRRQRDGDPSVTQKEGGTHDHHDLHRDRDDLRALRRRGDQGTVRAARCHRGGDRPGPRWRSPR